MKYTKRQALNLCPRKEIDGTYMSEMLRPDGLSGFTMVGRKRKSDRGEVNLYQVTKANYRLRQDIG